jgi:hypothetical protein
VALSLSSFIHWAVPFCQQIDLFPSLTMLLSHGQPVTRITCNGA